MSSVLDPVGEARTQYFLEIAQELYDVLTADARATRDGVPVDDYIARVVKQESQALWGHLTDYWSGWQSDWDEDHRQEEE